MTERLQEDTDIFAGPGEVRALCRALDWASTPLGPVSAWPAALRWAVRTVLDSPFAMNLWCGPERVLIYNDRYRAVLGSKHPASLGRAGAEVWSEIWPQIEPMFEQISAGGPPMYAEDAPFVVLRGEHMEFAGSAEPNAWFTFALSAVRDDEGRIVAYLNVVSETTARVQAERAREEALIAAEQAEARLREVFAQAPSFLAVLRGPEHIFEYVNDAYYQLVGHRELLNRPVFDALPEVRGQGFESLLDSVMRTGRPYIGREVPVTVQRTPDSEAEERFVDLVYYPVRDPNGEATGVVAHGSDVTEHVRARQEAQRARAEAEQANQAKSQFLANMSHEIRTPINAVVGYTDLLDTKIAGPLTDRQQEFVERIRSSSRHLLSLVNDVLDLAKIEAGEMSVRQDTPVARSVVSMSLQMVAGEAESRGLVLHDEWSCPEELRFVGDDDRVRQIVLNLLSNALKFTTQGGSITVRCRQVEGTPDGSDLPARDWVVLEVEDTGTGISVDQQARVFEAFVQAEGGHTRSAGGTGLGLTISRRLARLMNGDLTVRSQPGVGSCFSLWLPAHGGTADTVGSVLTSPRPAVTESAHAVLGQMLVEAAEILEEELVWQLRETPEGARLTRMQLANHTAPFIAAIGRALTALGDPHADESVVEDGTQIRMIMAQRHGLQRRRKGWTVTALDDEFRLLRELLEAHLRREAPRRTSALLDSALSALHRLIATAQAESRTALEGDVD